MSPARANEPDAPFRLESLDSTRYDQFSTASGLIRTFHRAPPSQKSGILIA
jgi:hypothetical protein